MATSTTTSTTTAVTTKDMKSKQLYLSMPRIPPKVYLKTVNPHITCNLCKGYLIDATTIVECLHSFCHSCIMMHLRRETYCPSCEMMINKVKPNIKPDATLQAIVYKLVPGLYEKELLRRRAFYKLRTKEALEATAEQRGDDTEHLIFGPNENISLMLEYSDNDNSHQTSDDENSNSSHEINSSDQCDDDFDVQLRKPKYLQCPAIFTISNLKKFLLHKFSINPSKFCVEIMYKVKSLALPDHYTLMDVAYIFTWKRDAPMKFLYCVRAASSPVANIEQSAVMYDLPSNRFQTTAQLVCASDSTDQEHDQSSDADSEVRSERTREPEINGTVARSSQPALINSTSDEPSSAPSSSSQLTTRTTSSATVTSTSVASTSTKSVSDAHSSLNGSENQKRNSSTKEAKESVSSPTTSSRLDSSIKTERHSSSPDKQQSDKRSNGASPKPNTSKSKSLADVKFSVSPSRTNQDLKDSKEKVKTKSIISDSAMKSGESSRSEPKTVTFSDKPTPLRSTEPKPIDRTKGRLLFNKEEKAKSLSPPLSAESEYDFDQHLLKEKLSEKTKFLSSIHLTPRIPSTDSPLVQLPKMPKTEQKSDATTLPTNLSKDKDNKLTNAIARTSVSSSSSSTDKQQQLIKKPENKASKRKSREPVKNVAKKCASPNERTIDTKWDPVKSTIVSSVSTSSPSISTATTSYPSSLSISPGDLRKVLPAEMVRMLGAIAQQNKNHQKSIQSSTSSLISKSNQASPSPSTSLNASSSKSVFKTPTTTSSKESPSQSGVKQSQPSTSESETSIIINNVQRPNQADTPRPTMSFKPNISQQQPTFFPTNLNRNFPNETEIQEIRNDDASKLKVYGPAMSLAKPFNPSIGSLSPPIVSPDLFHLMNQFGKQPSLHTLSGFPLNQLVALQQFNNLPMLSNATALKNSKPKIFVRKNSGAAFPARTVDVTDSAKQQNYQQLLTSCRLPPSLSITLTNDETESVNRSLFNTKNSNVVNSIEIVKLPDESSESNAKFASPTPSSSSDIAWANQMKLLANQQNNQNDTTSMLSESYQEKFLQSLKSLKKPKTPPAKQSVRSNLMDELHRSQESHKRKMVMDDKNAAKVRKLQQEIASQKLSPIVQRPVPDLLIKTDDKKVAVPSSSQSSAKSLANSKSAQDRQSPVSSTDKATAITLAVTQAKMQQVANEMPASKYMPLQTSSMPIWANHCTADQMASHKALADNLKQNTKNSRTFVD